MVVFQNTENVRKEGEWVQKVLLNAGDGDVIGILY